MPSVVTANNLRTGAVVYLTDDGEWVETLVAAGISNDAVGLERFEIMAQRSVEDNDVTSVYAMKVAVLDGRPQPVSVRETIRAARGPSV